MKYIKGKARRGLLLRGMHREGIDEGQAEEGGEIVVESFGFIFWTTTD